MPQLGTTHSGIDEMLLASKLREAKRRNADVETGESGENGEQSFRQKTFSERSKKEKKQEIKKIKANIKSESFSGWIFYVVMFLSVVKDLMDVANLMLSSATAGVFYFIGTFILWIVNAIITIALVLFFFVKFKSRKILLKYVKKYIFPIIVEFIPFVRVFPVYTASTILFKILDSAKTKIKISKTKSKLKKS